MIPSVTQNSQWTPPVSLGDLKGRFHGNAQWSPTSRKQQRSPIGGFGAPQWGLGNTLLLSPLWSSKVNLGEAAGNDVQWSILGGVVRSDYVALPWGYPLPQRDCPTPSVTESEQNIEDCREGEKGREKPTKLPWIREYPFQIIFNTH